MLKKLLKFGGSSIADAVNIKHVSTIIKKQNENINLSIVVSAFKGITDLLNKLAISASNGKNIESLFLALENKNIEIIKNLFQENSDKTLTTINVLSRELKNDLSEIYETRSLSLKCLDKITSYGELYSVCIISNFLNEIGISAEPLDAREVILTDDHFGNAYVHYQRSYDRIRAYCKHREKLQVITGFLGATEKKDTTTLGRSGSDYSASIFGAALNVDLIEIWTDVNGILSANPHIVPEATTVPHLTYEEAMELAHAGAKVIFPPTMIPALHKKIPIVIKNTFNPNYPGSLITNERKIDEEKVVGISSLSDISLIRLQGAGMIGMKGLIGRIFTSLAKEKINIILVSQTFSEHSICFAIDPKVVTQAITTLEEEFNFELKKHMIDAVKVEEHLSLVAVVGEGMRNTPGISGKIFGILGNEKINVVAIAQGSSERNISFIVEDKNVKKTVKALHEEFFNPRELGMDIFIAGVGIVGSELLKILHQIKPNKINIKGIASSKKMIVSKKSISPESAEKQLSKSKEKMDLFSFIKTEGDSKLKKIFVDCTASEELSEKYNEIIESGFSIVTANKIANTMNQKYYNQIRKSVVKHDVGFYYETNVGAGLPVISTLKNLIKTGDKIISIEGIFSGTLSYLFNTITPEIPFSELVRKAWEKGYTEPDPRNDLSGMDVARKLLILVRETGFELALSNIQIETLLPEGSDKLKSIEDFITHLSKFDGEMKSRLENALSNGKLLRYVGKFDGKHAGVSLMKTEKQHPFSTLEGSENIFIFKTNRYNNQPLIIKGHGAGASVTAAGVLSDIQTCLNSN